MPPEGHIATEMVGDHVGWIKPLDASVANNCGLLAGAVFVIVMLVRLGRRSPIRDVLSKAITVAQLGWIAGGIAAPFVFGKLAEYLQPHDKLIAVFESLGLGTILLALIRDAAHQAEVSTQTPSGDPHAPATPPAPLR